MLCIYYTLNLICTICDLLAYLKMRRSIKKENYPLCSCAVEENRCKDDQSGSSEKYFAVNNAKANKIAAVASAEKIDDAKQTDEIITDEKEERFALQDSDKIKKYLKDANGYEIDALHNVSSACVLSNRYYCIIYRITIQICYDRLGMIHDRRKNLREFKGFEFAVDSKEYNKRFQESQKTSHLTLAAICNGLNVKNTGELIFFTLVL